MKKILRWLIKHRPCFIFGHRFFTYNEWLNWSLGKKSFCSNCHKNITVKENK
jgi:hypothetical protein